MPDIATDAELREVAKQVKTRGMDKALRALEETRKYHMGSGTLGIGDCPLCHAYPPGCGPCPGKISPTNLCSRVSCFVALASDRPAAHLKVAKLCTRLMCFIRAEQKMMGH